MRVTLPLNEAQAEPFLPEKKADGSGVGINYADALLKPVKLTLDDGRKVAFKRRGLKITLTLGDKTGEGLLLRLEHGPDVRDMVLGLTLLGSVLPTFAASKGADAREAS